MVSLPQSAFTGFYSFPLTHMPTLFLWTRRTDPFSAATFRGHTEIAFSTSWIYVKTPGEQQPVAITHQLLLGCKQLQLPRTGKGCSCLKYVALPRHPSSMLFRRVSAPPSPPRDIHNRMETTSGWRTSFCAANTTHSRKKPLLTETNVYHKHHSKHCLVKKDYAWDAFAPFSSPSSCAMSFVLASNAKTQRSPTNKVGERNTSLTPVYRPITTCISVYDSSVCHPCS